MTWFYQDLQRAEDEQHSGDFPAINSVGFMLLSLA